MNLFKLEEDIKAANDQIKLIHESHALSKIRLEFLEKKKIFSIGTIVSILSLITGILIGLSAFNFYDNQKATEIIKIESKVLRDESNFSGFMREMQIKLNESLGCFDSVKNIDITAPPQKKEKILNQLKEQSSKGLNVFNQADIINKRIGEKLEEISNFSHGRYADDEVMTDLISTHKSNKQSLENMFAQLYFLNLYSMVGLDEWANITQSQHCNKDIDGDNIKKAGYIYHHRGYAYQVNKAYEKAKSSYSKAISFAPQIVNTYINLTECFILNQEYAEAKNTLDLARKKNQDKLYYHPDFEKLIIFFDILIDYFSDEKETLKPTEKKQIISRIHTFRKKINNNPILQYDSLSLKNLQLKQPDELVHITVSEFIKEMITLHSDRIKVGYYYLNKSISDDLNKVQYLQKALKNFEKELETSEICYLNWHFKGFTLYQLNRYQEAIDAYNKCTFLNPNFFKAYQNLAVIYWKLGEKENALDNIQCCENVLSKQNVKAQSNLKRLKFTINTESNEHKKAIEILKDEAVTTKDIERKINILLDIGKCYLELGKLDEANKKYQSAYSIFTKNKLGENDRLLNNILWSLITIPKEVKFDRKFLVDESKKLIKRKYNCDYIDTLAAAYAAEENFVDAVYFQKKAIQESSMYTDINTLKRMMSRLKLFQSEEAFSETNPLNLVTTDLF
jgi:tetratricopeptide (TPR) repeat protein